MEEIINIVLTAVLFYLALCIVMGLIRAFTGKKPADRLVAVNMITTAVIMMTIIFSVLFKESWLADIAAIYALVSFVAVIVFSRLYIVSHTRKKAAETEGKGDSSDGN